MEPIVQQILDRAEAHGLTPLALCREVGLHHSVLNRWRTGETSPTLTKLKPVIGYLDGRDAALTAKEKARLQRRLRKIKDARAEVAAEATA